MDPIFTQPMTLPPPRPKGGMFGGDGKFGVGQAIVAALNGYLAGMPGPSQQVGAQNLQMMAVTRQRQLERQQGLDDYNRKRADDNTDWQAHEQWKLDNPSPGDSEYDRALAAQGIVPGTPEYAQHMATIGRIHENPMVMTPYGPMPYSQAFPEPQPAPAGVTFTPLPEGGPTPGGSGGFPRY